MEELKDPKVEEKKQEKKSSHRWSMNEVVKKTPVLELNIEENEMKMNNNEKPRIELEELKSHTNQESMEKL